MNKGILYVAASNLLWGVLPVYFKALHSVPAVELVAHRTVWSFVFLFLIIAFRRELPVFKKIAQPRTLAVFSAAALLLAINWLTYVYGVNTGRVLEASLGYFINPLVTVLLGVIFLRERLRPIQWVPVALAFAGVAYLTISYGALPWIGLVLAFSFGLYGLVKKVSPLGSLHGLAVETSILLLPALVYILVIEAQGNGSFVHSGPQVTLLLSLSGIVTAVPLLFFAGGAQRIPLTTVGLLQYISPSCQFIMGVFLFREPFNTQRFIGFAIVWLGLVFFTVETYLERRQAASAGAPLSAGEAAPESK